MYVYNKDTVSSLSDYMQNMLGILLRSRDIFKNKRSTQYVTETPSGRVVGI